MKHDNDIILVIKKVKIFCISPFFLIPLAHFFGRREVISNEKNIFVFFRMEAESLSFNANSRKALSLFSIL